MKRIISVLLAVLLLLSLAACGVADKDDSEPSRNTGDVGGIGDKPVPAPITYHGHYQAEDGSTLDITSDGGTYGIAICIVRLTAMEDGTGEVPDGADTMSFTATDSAGNPIGGEIRWVDGHRVILRFTSSSWEYLPNGTEFSFVREAAAEPDGPQELPVTVDYADEAFVANGTYLTCRADDTEYTLPFVISARERVSSLTLGETELTDEGYRVTRTVETWKSLSPELPVLVWGSFPGDLSAYYLSWEDSRGNLYEYTLTMSGKDGSLVLSPF